jgi:transitional endoplasmic reticulum ATPase
MDARRGVVRLHRSVLDALGAKPWQGLALKGARVTGAMAAEAPPEMDPSMVLVDDITCANAGIVGGDTLEVFRAQVQPAKSVTIGGGDDDVRLEPKAVRLALLGKILTPGDRVSLLPQDFVRPREQSGLYMDAIVHMLASTYGQNWQDRIFKVTDADPAGLVSVTMETHMAWQGSPEAEMEMEAQVPQAPVDHPTLEELPGHETEIESLRELLDLGFNHTDLLAKLGTKPQMGVLVTGPPGSGKVAVVHAVAQVVGGTVTRLGGPALARLEEAKASMQLRRTLAHAESSERSIVLIEDVDALAPREEPGPLLSVLVEAIGEVVERGKAAVVCTTAHPENTSPELRRPGCLNHEIELSLLNKDERRRVLEVKARGLALAPDVKLDEIASRTPGFVAADLEALGREAALRAAQRAAETKVEGAIPAITQPDYEAALEVVKPSSMEGMSIELADVRMEDVGNMEVTKTELTEAVIWPLRYPDAFERLGVAPPRGVLLYGPPGCGKTFLVKALANQAEANFLSIKGAELLSKWVGESERAVRQLFRRARSAAPAVVFFDEIDALAPQRGASHDSGTTDRVVAQLLTELDGVDELRDVSVIAATNRPDLIDPALLRPGRFERLVFVPAPDAEARSLILSAVTRRMPCAPDVDAAALGRDCEGFSAADLAALARRAAMSAMRENMEQPFITHAHFEKAKAETKPSLRAEQLAELEAFASRRSL